MNGERVNDLAAGLSLSRLAKELGRAKSGLHKLAKRRQIPQRADGSFDIDEVRAALARNIDPAKKRPAAAKGARASVRTRGDVRRAVALIGRVLAEEGVAVPDGLNYGAIRMAETILKSRERDLAMQVKSGKLVDAEAVEAAVFRLARADRDALQNWPSRVGPVLAAELGVDAAALIIVLEKHVRAYLSERSQAAYPRRDGAG